MSEDPVALHQKLDHLEHEIVTLRGHLDSLIRSYDHLGPCRVDCSTGRIHPDPAQAITAVLENLEAARVGFAAAAAACANCRDHTARLLPEPGNRSLATVPGAVGMQGEH